MSRDVTDCLRIMRLAISRRNASDPDSTDDVLLQYLNDFLTLSMSSDVRVFEKWSTLEFVIDETVTDGVYNLEDITNNGPGAGTGKDFVTINMEALISLTETVDSSVSWNNLAVYQDPFDFYGYWGFNNVDVLQTGFPTQMLYYENQFIFRTIPNDSYTVRMWGYQKNSDLTDNSELPEDYWLRYVAYGAALQYGNDHAFDDGRMAQMKKSFVKERSFIMARSHNQLKLQRGFPRF